MRGCYGKFNMPADFIKHVQFMVRNCAEFRRNEQNTGTNVEMEAYDAKTNNTSKCQETNHS